MKSVTKRIAGVMAIVISAITVMACGKAVDKERLEKTQSLLDDCDVITVTLGTNDKYSFSGALYEFYTYDDIDKTAFRCTVGPDGKEQGLENREYQFQSKDEFNGLVALLKDLDSEAYTVEEDPDEERYENENYVAIGLWKNKNYDMTEADSYWLKISDIDKLKAYLDEVYNSCE